MNVFAIGDRLTSDSNLFFEFIDANISKLGHKLDNSWITAKSEEDSNNFELAHKRNMRSIKNCDVLIAEVTQFSSGVGFLVATALNHKKPVLALYRSDKTSPESTTLKGSASNKLLSYQKYDEDELESILRIYFKEAKSKLDTKFILIIPPTIDRYLEWASDERRMHKAQIVRNAVENVMEKDKEWQEFNKDN